MKRPVPKRPRRGALRRPGLDTLRKTLIFRLLREGMRDQGWLYAVAIVAMLVVAVTSSLTAWVMEAIIEAMTSPDDRARVATVSLLVMGIFVTKGIATYIQVVFLSRAGNSIVARQQTRLYQKLVRQGVSFFNQMESSELLMRVTQSAQSARSLIDLVVTSAVRDMLTLLGLVAVMIYQQPLLSCISLIVAPLAILGIRLILRRVRTIMETEMASLSEIIKVLQETSNGIRIIKVFSLEDRMNRRMQLAVASVEKRSNAIARLEAVTSPLMETLSGFAIAAVVWVSALGVVGTSPTTPGQLISFVTALLMAYEPAKRLSRVRVNLEALMVGVRMMFEILDHVETVSELPEAASLKPGPGQVLLKGVSFSYGGLSQVLDGIDVEFEAGKMSALVGPSGSGKTTLFNLVMRLYDPSAGAVLIDGQDIRSVTMSSFRQRMSFVGQDTFLFSTTVMDNIRCSRPDASDREVHEAARAAHAHDFIETLPNGYQTLVGENGTFLSGGQRQRLSIARAFLRRSDILLLDEATSALDATSESLIKDALKHVSIGITTIVIAHRLSTILEADRIFVMDKGRIVERGSASELMMTNGLFRTLFDQQFGRTTGMITSRAQRGQDLLA